MLALRHPKVVELGELLQKLTPLRQDKRVVFTNGCFDIIHPGHVDLLAKARAMGDLLVLGLNSDKSVRRLAKGEGRPFNTYAARAYVLAHLESVDFVVKFTEDTPLELIRVVQPNVLVKGGDYRPETIVGRELVEAGGGEVRVIPLLTGWSTTQLAQRVAQHASRGLLR